MPAKSRQQYKFFKEMEENPELAKQRGIKPGVAQEFTEGMTKERFAKLKSKIGKK
jgi:hypothetical protein